jgi:hypothetical protein
MSFSSPTIIHLSDDAQIRIQVNEYKGVTRLDIREYRVFDGNKEFKPTKKGVTFGQEVLALVKSGIEKHGKELPNRVVDIDEGTKYVIGKTAEDAVFHKKHVFGSKEDAKAKSPPDGYSIFKVLIKDGAVIKQQALLIREDGEWVKAK